MPVMSSPEQTPRFGALLRAHRARAGLSLRKLAERSGIVFSFLSQIEHAQRSPNEDHVDALCTAFGLGPDERHQMFYAAALEQLSPAFRAAMQAGPQPDSRPEPGQQAGHASRGSGRRR
jgi:transcriptional regulator with XRE-family HTH domain